MEMKYTFSNDGHRSDILLLQQGEAAKQIHCEEEVSAESRLHFVPYPQELLQSCNNI